MSTYNRFTIGTPEEKKVVNTTNRFTVSTPRTSTQSPAPKPIAQVDTNFPQATWGDGSPVYANPGQVDPKSYVKNPVVPTTPEKQTAPINLEQFKGQELTQRTEQPVSKIDKHWLPIRNQIMSPGGDWEKEKAMKERLQSEIAYDRQNDPNFKEPSGLAKTSLETEAMSFPEKLITAALLPGLAVAPLKVALGAAKFGVALKTLQGAASLITGKNIQSFSDVLPENYPQYAKDTVDVLGYIGTAWGTHKLNQKLTPVAKATFEKMTKNVITKFKMPERYYIEPAKIRSIFQTGKGISPQESEMVRALGLDAAQYKNAFNNGLTVEVPSHKIVTIADKPYWSKVKGLFNLDSKPTVITSGQTTPAIAPRGFLTSGTAQVPVPPIAPQTPQNTFLNSGVREPTLASETVLPPLKENQVVSSPNDSTKGILQQAKDYWASLPNKQGGFIANPLGQTPEIPPAITPPEQVPLKKESNIVNIGGVPFKEIYNPFSNGGEGGIFDFTTQGVEGFTSSDLSFDIVNGNKVATISSFEVAEKLRGKGVGRKLFEYMQQKAIDQGAKEMEIMHVESTSRGFWRKMGFEPASGQENSRTWVKNLPNKSSDLKAGVSTPQPKDPNQEVYKIPAVPGVKHTYAITEGDFGGVPFRDIGGALGGKSLNAQRAAPSIDNLDVFEIAKRGSFGPTTKTFYNIKEHNISMLEWGEAKKESLLTVFKQLSNKEAQQIANFRLGDKTTPLPPRLDTINKELNVITDGIWNEYNLWAEQAGQSKIGHIDDYLPKRMEQPLFTGGKSAKISSSFTKPRTEGDLPGIQEKKLEKLLATYVNNVGRKMFLEAPLKQLEYVSGRLRQEKQIIKGADFLDKFVQDTIKPHVSDTILEKGAEKIIAARSTAALAGNVLWSTFVQGLSAALITGRNPNAVAISKGIANAFTKETLEWARTLPTYREKVEFPMSRTGMGDIGDAGMQTKLFAGRAKWNKALGWYSDTIEGKLSLLAASVAREYGLSIGMKEGEALDTYADLMIAATQSEYTKMARPEAMQNVFMRLFAPFQTYAFESYDFGKTLVGAPGGGIPIKRKGQAIKQAMSYVATLLALDYFFARMRGKKMLTTTVGSHFPVVGPVFDEGISWGLSKATGMDIEMGRLGAYGRTPVSIYDDYKGIMRAIDKYINTGDMSSLRRETIKWGMGFSGIAGASTLNRIFDQNKGGDKKKSKRF